MNIRYHSLFILSGCLLCASHGSDATAIYKYQLPDGSILYSQTAGRNGKLLEVMQVRSPSRAQLESQKSAQKQLEQEMARSERLTTIRNLRHNDTCDASYASSGGNIVYADAFIPRPGERTGTVGGFSRLNDAYWQRIYGISRGVDFVLDPFDPSRTEYERLR